MTPIANRSIIDRQPTTNRPSGRKVWALPLALPLRGYRCPCVFLLSPKQNEALCLNSVSGCSIASQGRFCFSKNDPLSFQDITFRVDVAKTRCPPTKYSLSGFICVISLIPAICVISGNATNGAGPDLCSTRAWGKDDGS